MEPEPSQTDGGSEPERRWQPISSVYRRIVGVLVEKAKTTPDAYPLSLNALTTGCNQKSNRAPQMNLTTDLVEESLEKLRYMGAVSEVQGGGRVPKYRHYMKDWLGVDGVELAVMAELLLRGPQTVGELRGRAARMAKIADVTALMPLLDALQQKGLVVSLTPEGRGQVISHTLHTERETEQLKAQYSGAASQAESWGDSTATRSPDPAPAVSPAVAPGEAPAATAAPATGRLTDEVAELRREVSELKEEADRVRREIEDLWSNLR